ncbi:hypothetical protein EXS73_03375 [Candidatus Pacearchaeota archaeon]|nr:hypothetical protein [Candidatus Pacearchaeota archaeon]
MKKQLTYLLSALVITLSMLGGVYAESSPYEPCLDDNRYDFNGDGRVSPADMTGLVTLWKDKQIITQEYINFWNIIPNQAYKNYLTSYVTGKEGNERVITQETVSDLGYQFSLCSKEYLGGYTSSIGYDFQGRYLNTGDDQAGKWYQFGSSAEHGEGYSPDFSFNVTLSPIPNQKIIAATLVHNVPGEAWSTSDDIHDLGKLLYPLVVYSDYNYHESRSMTKGYNNVIFYPRNDIQTTGQTTPGTLTFTLYAQVGAPFEGGKLIFYFEDNTSIGTEIQPKGGRVIIDDGYPFLTDGISLGRLTDGSYGCFGCGELLCVDPAPDVVMVTESINMFCASDFTITQGENAQETTGTAPTTPITNTQTQKPIPSFAQSCFSGCLSADICYPIGYRTATTYCVPEGNFTTQKEAEVSCNNSFECSSNLCLDNKCADQGFIQKILAFFANMFN